MGRILDARGDEALDVLADLLGPVSEIAQDSEISGMMKTGGGGTIMDFAIASLKNHKDAVIEIMAIDDGKTVEEERRLISVLTIPARLMALIKIPAVSQLLFGAAEGTNSESGSSSASESEKE